MKKSIKLKIEVLIDLRRKNNLSQEDLAELIGVSRQTISKWETGEKIPDLDNVNKLCKEFKVDINQLIDGMYENKNQTIENNKKKSMIRKIIIAIIVIYLLTVLPKAILFSYILHKNNIKYIQSYGYTYNQETCFKDGEMGIARSRTVFHKDDIEHQIESSGITDVYSADIESWMFINEQEYYEYTKGTEFENNTEKEYYDYHTGAVYVDTTPFQYVTLYKYKLGILPILNPFRFYKINDEGEMIVPLDEDGSKFYIDIRTGYLNKVKFVIGGSSYNECVYMGVQVNDIEDSQVELKEEIKNEIIEKSKNNEVDSSDIYYSYQKTN